MSRVWNDRRFRSVAWQVIATAAVIALGGYLLVNLLDNLERRGIASGFGFLESTAGFGITMSLIEYSEESTYGRAFMVGLLNTILVSAIGIGLATILGFIIGIARLSANWLVARLATVYIETLRNIPLLLQIFFWYFAVLRTLPPPRSSLEVAGSAFLNNRGLYLPGPVAEPGFAWLAGGIGLAVIGVWLLARWARRRRERSGQSQAAIWGLAAALLALPLVAAAGAGFPLSWDVPALRGFNFRGGWVLIPELAALVVALSLYTAAFIAEVVRAGIESVDRGQIEAARALGLGPAQTLRHVVIPQALRVIIPPLTNQYLNLTKNSSLAAAIAYPDLVSVFGGTVLNQTGQAVEVIAITMAVYLFISLTISLLMNWYNSRIVGVGG